MTHLLRSPSLWSQLLNVAIIVVVVVDINIVPALVICTYDRTGRSTSPVSRAQRSVAAPADVATGSLILVMTYGMAECGHLLFLALAVVCRYSVSGLIIATAVEQF